MTSIDIIGGGFSGTMVLHHLMQHNLPPMDIYFYDMNGAHGRGVAYGTPFDEHLLNVPASNMSALPDIPTHFAEWLPANSPTHEFYSRKLYGDYLSGFLEGSMKTAAAKNHRLHILSRKAPEDTTSDIVVHATGTAQPAWPGNMVESGHKFMVPNPYGTAFKHLLQHCAEIKSIAILGTGLSAVDAILSLHKAGYKGKILAMSRRAFWPAAHGPKNRFWHWRKYIDGLRPYSNKLWRKLPEDIRSILLKRLTYWNVLRHRMPAHCRSTLRDMEKQGQLLRVKGSISKAFLNSSRICVVSAQRNIEVDAVINCLGHVAPAKTAVPIAENSFRINAQKPVFTLGPPLFGYYIESTAVPELRSQAQRVAAEISELILQGK